MAYISQQQNEDEERRRVQPGAPTTFDLSGAGGGGAPAAPSAPAAPGTASRFVNFSRMLNANRDVTNRTADQLVGSLDQQASSLESDLAKAPAAPAPGAGFVPPIMRKDPAPTSMAGLQARAQTLGQDLQKAENTAGTSGGVGAMLQQQAQGQYGAGARSLDSALVGGAAAGRLRDMRDRYGRLSSVLGTAQTQDAQAQQAQNEEAEAQQRAESAGIRRERVEDRISRRRGIF